MAHRLRAVELGFLVEAPLRFEYVSPDLPATPAELFAVICSDPSGWSWFPGLEAGGYEGDEPHGVGSRRWVRMGETTYRETILAWDEPTRWAYRVDETTDEVFDALLEDWVIEPADGGSRLRWTFAFAPLAELADVLAGSHEFIGQTFTSAMSGLSEQLRGLS
ncbi:MAG: SRPBCC family protein [Acidimicrobiia bacterium]